MKPLPRLIFVYNARSGTVNSWMDTAHKMLKPETYSCRLCALTFGPLREKKAWKDFRKNSEIPMEFLHVDEFQKNYASKFGAKFEFPVVLLAGNSGFEMVMDAGSFQELDTVEGLIARLNHVIAGLPSR